MTKTDLKSQARTGADLSRRGYASRMALLGAVAAGTLFAGCPGCEEAGPINITSRIAVDACTGGEVRADDLVLGGVSECALAFGDTPLSTRVPKKVVLHNPSATPLVIKSIKLSDDTDPAFILSDNLPEEIASGFRSELSIEYRPLLESEVAGKLIIVTDAGNVPGYDSSAKESTIEIDITGTGIDDGLPEIELDPAECNFGRVAIVNGIGQCQVAVKNVGQRALLLDSVAFVDDSLSKPDGAGDEPFAFFGRPPGPEDAIEPGAEATVSLRFVPDTLGDYGAQVRLMTNDPDEREVLIDVSGEGVNPPTACCEIESVNGEPYTDGMPIEPLDDIVMSAACSTPGDDSGSITRYEWTAESLPSGSHVQLENPNGATTGLSFAGGTQGLDVAGPYSFGMTVYDDLGTASTNHCTVDFEAIPTDTFLAQLSWDTSFGDMDLHVIKKNDAGKYCGSGVAFNGLAENCSDRGQVCYFSNCKATSTSFPEWDGVSGRTDGDPALDIDDVSGFGPENINIDVAVAGHYLVGVDHYSGAGGSGNTLRLYIYGQLQAEFFNVLNDSDWWEVAVVHWPEEGSGMIPCIESLETNDLECPEYGAP